MNNRGFTLIELLVTMLIGLVVLGALTTFGISQMKGYGSNWNNVNNVQTTRTLIQTLMADLRMIGYNTSTEHNTITTATPKSIQIYSDLNQDNNYTGTDETITLTYDPNTFILTRNNEIIADTLTNFNLTYYDGNGNDLGATPTLSLIRKIKLDITVRTSTIDPMTNQYKTIDFTTFVSPRNLSL